MKRIAIAALLVSMTAMFAFSQDLAPVKTTLVDGINKFGSAQWDDIKTNSGFKIESAMTTAFFDTNEGKKFASVTVPFLHMGSYLYLGGGYAHTIGLDPRGMALLGPGLRLNDVIRPAIKKGLEAIPYVGDKADLVSGLASAISFNVQAGHDFNHTNRENVVFNRIGVALGLEYAFGATPSAPSAQSSTKGWSLR